ncbi:MAG: gas vesicle protein [Proteobacteria bacterium]|nr:gas vesicle protein [Pseudomonadota bacterium]
MAVNKQYQDEQQQISLCEALDRILNKGVVIVADITISVANIDLIYLNLQALVSSVEAKNRLPGREQHHDNSSIIAS